MGLQYRRRVRLGRGVWLNVSRRGVSASGRVGPVTVNSRGSVFIRTLIGGLFYRGRL